MTGIAAAPRTEYEAVESLTTRGYQPLDEVRGISTGSRVHHIGEKWFEAHTQGTATVVGVFEKAPSGWSQSYGSRDIEMVVRRDRDDTFGQWADYHAVLAEPFDI